MTKKADQIRAASSRNELHPLVAANLASPRGICNCSKSVDGGIVFCRRDYGHAPPHVNGPHSWEAPWGPPEGNSMARRYISLNVVHPVVQGYIVAWHSSLLNEPIPQWPQIRVMPKQEVVVAIDPSGRTGMNCMTDLGYRSNTKFEAVQVCAIIECDDGHTELLPFPPFKWEDE